MNEDPKSYDPRIAYEWVPAFLVVVMVIFKCFTYFSPYIAALLLDAEQVGLILTISSDETFNMILVTLIGFWIGKKVESNKIN